ncbi:hypothetical protein SeMB42_g04234 [Synchytrium endobioticum]|nr:hypothetical protein SeMB42_g04234 [Synchytrium endobioticum]
MLSKIIVAVLAASATVIAAPAVTHVENVLDVNKETDIDINQTYIVTEVPDYSGKESFDDENYDQGYANNDFAYGAEKYGQGHGYEETGNYMYGAQKYDQGYGHEGQGGYEEGYEIDHDTIYAKEILCPAVYKVIYMTVPVKCDCKTETRYGKSADVDIKNVQFEKEYKYYDGKSSY